MSPFDIGFPNVWRVIRPDWKMNSTWITTIKKKKKKSAPIESREDQQELNHLRFLAGPNLENRTSLPLASANVGGISVSIHHSASLDLISPTTASANPGVKSSCLMLTTTVSPGCDLRKSERIRKISKKVIC